MSAVVVTVYPPLCAGWRVMVATGLLLGLSWLESRLRVGSSTSGVQIADMSGMLTLVSIGYSVFMTKIQRLVASNKFVSRHISKSDLRMWRV